MDNLTQKNFLTRRIDFDELKICFYSDIEEGEYIIIDNIELTVYDVIIAPEKRRGRYDFFFLMYSEKKKELMKVYPCYYTKRKMSEYYDILKVIYDVIIAPEKRRGRYDFFFLMYSEKKKELMKLFPCYYTKRKNGVNIMTY